MGLGDMGLAMLCAMGFDCCLGRRWQYSGGVLGGLG